MDSIGSDKVSFEGCQLAISKLEPYLGKVLIDPPEGAGYRIRSNQAGWTLSG